MRLEVKMGLAATVDRDTVNLAAAPADRLDVRQFRDVSYHQGVMHVLAGAFTSLRNVHQLVLLEIIS